jgi:uncharacterized protein (DUF58 family)
MAKIEAYKYFDPRSLKRLKNMTFVARFLVEGFISGLHRSPHKGFSVEFAEYRKYVVGDDIRRIDWKVYPKTHKLYVKEYQEETNLRCYILLDVSASMGYGSGELTKLEYASYLAGAVAYLMTKQRDAVGLVLFSDGIELFIPPKSSPLRLRQILVELEKVRPTHKTSVASAFHAMAARIKRRGLILILSDLYDDPETVLRAFQHFRHRRHEVLVFHLLDHAEIEFPFDGLVSFRDMETRDSVQVYPRYLRTEYKKKLENFIRTYQKRCSDSDIEYLQIDTTTPYDALLASYLAKRSRLG